MMHGLTNLKAKTDIYCNKPRNGKYVPANDMKICRGRVGMAPRIFQKALGGDE
jgi:hypothetical protein